jgi:hypothetical protein
MTEETLTISAYMERLREQNPDIRPCGEEDWDWNWADEGVDLMECGEYLLAERKFQELILARPNEYEGYEGLALVCRALWLKEEAALLIGHAVLLAQAEVERDLLDRAVLDELAAEQNEILSMADEPPPPESD